MQKLNKYIKNINRVEFVITNACNGHCKHCSEGELKGNYKLDSQKASVSRDGDDEVGDRVHAGVKKWIEKKRYT